MALSTATATSSKDDDGEELHDHASSCFSSTETNESCDEVDGSVDVPCDARTQTSYTSSSDVGVQTDIRPSICPESSGTVPNFYLLVQSFYGKKGVYLKQIATKGIFTGF